jgi:hypothetical protein
MTLFATASMLLRPTDWHANSCALLVLTTNCCCNCCHDCILPLQAYAGANDPDSACYGITKTLQVPNGRSVSSDLTPMLPPGVVQAVLEKRAKAEIAIKVIQVYISMSFNNA